MVVEPIIKVIESSDPLLEKILERSFWTRFRRQVW